MPSSRETIFANESGSLMDTKNPTKLPKDRYIDLDFDVNNSRMIEEALIDTRTAAASRTLQGFLGSEAFSKMFGTVGTEGLVRSRITEYVNRKRKKTVGTSEEIETINFLSNMAAKAGTIYALATGKQPVLQTVPIALSTMLNSGELPNLGVGFDKEYIKWLEDNGSELAIRGLESDTAIERAEINLRKNSRTTRKLLKLLDGLGTAYLKAFLAHPDKYIARVSFLQYYKQGLKRYGLDDNVDFSKPMNKKAERYANAMVTRMQNISDPDKAGNLWTSKHWASSLIRKTAFPFANFVINQKVRMYTDLKKIGTIDNWTGGLGNGLNNTKEVKDALISLTSTFFIEAVAYHSLSATFRYAYRMYSDSVVGGEESEEDEAVTRLVKKENQRRISLNMPVMNKDEEREFRAGSSDTDLGREVYYMRFDRELKTGATALYKDIVSPLPILDDAFVYLFNESAKAANKASLQEDIDEAINMYAMLEGMKGSELSEYDVERITNEVIEEKTFQLWLFDDDSYGKSYGTIGIAMDKYKDYFESADMANKGYYINKKGDPMFLIEEDQEIAKANHAMNRMYMWVVLPGDVGSIARYNQGRLRERGLSANQFVDYKIFKGIIEKLNKEGQEVDPLTMEEIRMVSRGDGSFEDVLKKSRGELDIIPIMIERDLMELDIKLEADNLTNSVQRSINQVNEFLERNK
jgi:hypothetical protein